MKFVTTPFQEIPICNRCKVRMRASGGEIGDMNAWHCPKCYESAAYQIDVEDCKYKAWIKNRE